MTTPSFIAISANRCPIGAWRLLLLGVAAASVAGCSAPRPASTGPLAPSPWKLSTSARAAAAQSLAPAQPTPTITPDQQWRPEWWSNQTLRDDGLVTVWAMADDEDLLRARASAIKGAEAMFAKEAGRPPLRPMTLTDSTRLDSGVFRAFVRLQGVPNYAQ